MSNLSADERNHLDEGAFAFPKERKGPLKMRATFATPSPASIR